MSEESTAQSIVEPDAENLRSLADVARALNGLSHAKTLNDEEQDFRALHILERSVEIGETNESKLFSFIRKHLLPRCWRRRTPRNTGVAYRALLGSWIESLPENVLWKVREQLLAAIILRLQRTPSEETMYCLGTIGLRNEKTVDALKRIAKKRNDKTGDRALRILVGMAPDAATCAWVTRVIRSRLRHRSNEELLSAASLLADPALLDLFVDPARAEAFPPLAFGSLVRMCDAALGDGALQNRVWHAMMELRRRIPKGWELFLFSAGVVQRCNSTKAVYEVVTALPDVKALGEIHVYRWCHQLDGIRSRAQVLGWKQVEVSPVAECLRSLITSPSRQEGNWRTTESRLKRDAIHTMLCLGDSSLLDLANDSIRFESNPYVQHEVMEHLAVLSFDKVPEEAVSLLQSAMNDKRDDEFPVELTYLGAARLATSSLNFLSLDLLMRSMSSERKAFITTIEDAGALAAYLLRYNEEEVLSILRRSLMEPTSVGAVAIALNAIRRAAFQGPLLRELMVYLDHLAMDANQPSHIREDALFTIAIIALRTREPGLLPMLRSLVADPDHRVREAAMLSLAAVAPPAELRKIVQTWLKISSPTGAARQTFPRNIAAALGRVAARDPHHSVALITQLISNSSDETAEAVLWGFQGARKKMQTLGQEMARALISRIKREESLLMGNATFLQYLATLAPTLFLTEQWDNVWLQWMPESRKALADSMTDAVALVPRDPNLRDRASAMLEKLIGDASFAVRRGAARAFAEIDGQRLHAWCNAAAASGSIAARRIAAYASGWLPLDSDGTLDNEFLRRFHFDSERSVREAADWSRDETRRRRWASELLEMIRKPHPDSNERVLRGYAASRGLAAVGDDQDIKLLNDIIGDDELAPNIRYWLTRTREALKKQWEETARKWPEPWLSWEGAIERLDGEIATSAACFVAELTLWQKRGFANEYTAWGGSAKLHDSGGVLRLMFSSRGSVTLRIAGRTESRILVTQTTETGALFSGSGEYPKQLSN